MLLVFLQTFANFASMRNISVDSILHVLDAA